MSGEKIQVREGWWRQRCGHIVHVTPVMVALGSGYKWECAIDVYFDNGRTEREYETLEDLVEFLGKNITITSAD